MARPAEFDRNQALEASMKLFWSQGYTATSLHQLLDTTGIGRSSFYAAFGDKRSLFIEVLRLFSVRTQAMLSEAWEETHSLFAIRRFFRETLIQVPRVRASRGCLMINSILELAEVDEGLSNLAIQELAEVESIFETCFSEAQASGDYPDTRPPRDLAAHVMVLNQGLRVASRKSVSRRELERLIETGLSLLDLPTSA
jgi:TetR/AcrR family transcriptional regulator, transcriptional repressor for nem operon